MIKIDIETIKMIETWLVLAILETTIYEKDLFDM